MPLSLLAGTPLPRSCAGWSQLQHDDQATRCPLMRELTTSYLKISNLSQKINVDNILSKMTKPGAPRRALTCWDSISDLPPIPSGHDQLSINYQAKPRSHLQRNFRQNATKLTDHITKPLNPLQQERVNLIPTDPGSDWRDLPNKVKHLDKC